MLREPRFVEIRPRTRRLGHDIVHLGETSSTMAEARQRAEAGAPEGLVVVADRQTSGVGRKGKSWATVGDSLHATLLLRPAVPAAQMQLLPLVAGSALCAAARRLLRVELRLKWPNDLLYEGRKVGGVLVDAVYAGGATPQYVLVGIGVNGDARVEEFPPELRETAASLSMVVGHHVCLPAFLKLALEAFEPRYDALVSRHVEPLWQEVRGLVRTIGRRVVVRTNGSTVEGLAADLGPDGELLVRTKSGTEVVVAGECEELRDL